MTDEKNLETSLRSLLLEIKSLGAGDDAGKQRLESLVEEIEGMLERPKDRTANPNIGDRWRASILSFEASHPRLAGVMNEVVAELSNMGI